MAINWYQCNYCLDWFLKKDLHVVPIMTIVQVSPLWVAVCSECLEKIEENNLLVELEKVEP